MKFSANLVYIFYLELLIFFPDMSFAYAEFAYSNIKTCVRELALHLSNSKKKYHSYSNDIWHADKQINNTTVIRMNQHWKAAGIFMIFTQLTKQITFSYIKFQLITKVTF